MVKKSKSAILLVILMMVVVVSGCSGTGTPAARNRERSGGRSSKKATAAIVAPPAFANQDFIAPEIMGQPGASAITINALPAAAMEVYYEYGATPGAYTLQTPTAAAAAGLPLETRITGLEANTRYYYRLRYRKSPSEAFSVGEESSWMTQRAPGSTFTFGIQGDSHPERTKTQFNAALYARALQNAAGDQPDFYFTIGDDFSVDTLASLTASTVTQLYINQRQWLGAVGAPVFLVNGNHEQAALANLDGTAENVAVWAQKARNAYYPQPAPDDFYSGDGQPVDFIGQLRDYYAFTWGDALFVVIDPYWHSSVVVDNRLDDAVNTRDFWDITLGERQYQWFKQTLEQSTAQFKFVFAHHVNGTGRGGIELADLYEWGGYDRKGVWGFDQKRPGWSQPLHDLMAQNGVTIFFQGHDHIFVQQELDGVVYQSLPAPADPNYSLFNADSYLSGVELPNSGHVRVTVSPQEVKVDYVRAYLPEDESAAQVNGSTAYSYTVTPREILPAFPGTVIPGSPTDQGILFNVLASQEVEAYLEYGANENEWSGQTAITTLAAGVPAAWRVEGLAANTRYHARMRFRLAGETDFSAGVEQSFQTQRAAGSSFVFAVEADPHNREPNFNGSIYTRTLNNILADQPDFLIDLGDTFMTEKAAASSYDEVVQTLLEMRPYFHIAGLGAPLYLVNGNHEGELGWLLDGTNSNLATWSTQARRLYYPNPTPGGFYSGSLVEEDYTGARDGYYAWRWGDALFVVLDPFWYTTSKSKPGLDSWNWTLGKAQYDWLEQVLTEGDGSPDAPKFKFVFAHQLVGGSNDDLGIGRGGIEYAPFYEWGGYNLDGTWGFEQHRPGWSKPIHQLFVETGVTIFFHGHDHLFVKQDLDGVVYQEAPQPSYTNYDNTNSAAGYGYVNGVLQGNAGHLRVSVSPQKVTVDYVRAYLPQDENANRSNGMVSYSYTILAAEDLVMQECYLPLAFK